MKIDEMNKKAAHRTDELSFLDHLEELRWHIIRALVVVFVLAIVVYVVGNPIFDYIILAPKQASFITYEIICSISSALCFSPADFTIETIKLGEQFFVHLKVSLLLGLFVGFPYVFWEIWRFVSPGLYSTERKAVRGIVFICSLLFALGVLFGYFVIAPFAITFLSNYSVGAETKASLTDFVYLMTMFTLPPGILFQLPIITFFLSRVGLLTASFLKTYRKHAFIIILILAAIITPPDFITQLFIGFPLYALYEVSILIAKREEKRYKEKFEKDL